MTLQSDGSHVTEAGKEFVHALKAAQDFVNSEPNAILVPAYGKWTQSWVERIVEKRPNLSPLFPSDDHDVFEGHASLVYEIQRQLKEQLGRDTEPEGILVSCGGGGLLGGILVGTEKIGWKNTRLVAIESKGVSSSFFASSTVSSD